MSANVRYDGSTVRSSRQLLELAKELGGDERLAAHVRAALGRREYFGIYPPYEWNITDAARAVATRFSEVTSSDPDTRWLSVAIIPKPRDGEALSPEDDRFLIEIATAHGCSPVGLVSPPNWMTLARAWLHALRMGRELAISRGQIRRGEIGTGADFSSSPLLHRPGNSDRRVDRLILSGVSLKRIDRPLH